MRTVAFIFVLAVSGHAVAQTACPQGVTAGSALCGPSPAAGNYESAPQPVIRYVPTGRWHTRWGALAMDRKTGRTGVSAEQETEADARAEALEQCGLLKSASCSIDTVYSNGCVAMGWPVEGGFVTNYVAQDRAAAEAGAMKRCTEKNGAACVIKFADCSKPVFERF
jgi:hypothetical protein